MTVPTRSRVRAGARIGVRLHPEAIALIAAAMVPLLVGLFIAAGGPARVERLEIRNETTFRLTVSVRGESDRSGVPIAYVWPDSTDVATEFSDPGDTWIIDVESERGTSAELTVSRADLAAAGWTYTVAAGVEELLRP